MDEEAFTLDLAARLASLPGVEAVTLGGSRAQGGVAAGADFDVGLYYRAAFDVSALAAAGFEGRVFPLGGWGGGVMNGGAWLVVGERKVDLHYRDLDDVERRWAEAEAGRFEKELLSFYLAGVPTYLPVAELALSRVLAGQLPRPTYPEKLAAEAARRWHDDALATLAYAAAALERRGDTAVASGNLARGLVEEAHSRLAARREWVLNEKGMVTRAGLDQPTDVFAVARGPGGLPAALADASARVGG